MKGSKKKKLIAIVGPTASGKTDLAVYIAKKFNGEVVSADSRQVYKWMDIGTGKATKEEMDGIPHYLLDVVHPKEQFTVAEFKEQAADAIKKIYKKNKLPIIAGGTGFYIQAVVDDINFPEVPPNQDLRKELDKYSTEKLFKILRKKDPRRAKTIQKENKRRLIRALEIIEETGNWVPVITKNTPYDLLIIGIKMPREKLDKRIKIRLDARFDEGMVKEVKNLHKKKKVSWKRLENFGLEYRWIARYLQDKISEEEMKEELYKDIKRYARRQMTWFKRDKRINWLELKTKDKLQKEADSLVEKFLKS
ncbi:MAG: tRNA (adenosine(37)-N6)-dimethylallyltransferase MiaA [Candidatus Spechtbacterales bacterium]|nr:tRNA (adenosine(37)-N6)-dimethylallyltransferase MiaA [Candidatus Spechtbacterales bacterium]